MKLNMRSVLTLFLIIFGISLQGMAQNEAKITGSIIDSENNAVKGVKIGIVDFQSREMITSVKSDKNGYFTLKFDKVGAYQLYLQNNEGQHLLKHIIDEALKEPADFRITITDNGPVTNTSVHEIDLISEAIENINTRGIALRNDVMAFFSKPGNSNNPDVKYEYDVTETKLALEQKIERLKNERDEELELMLTYFEYLGLEALNGTLTSKDGPDLVKAELNPEIVAEALELIEPSWNMWLFSFGNIGAFATVLKDQFDIADRYAQRMIEEQSTEPIKTKIIRQMIFATNKTGNSIAFDEYAAKLLSFYPNSSDARYVKANYDFETTLNAGNIAPVFNIPNLDNPDERITEKDFKGKYYLLDFWSLSCGGCIQEMPEHERVYHKYNKKGFEILSVTVDDERLNQVEKFRNTRHALSWSNGIAEGGFSSKIVQDYEVGFLPRLFLIDPKGKIVARDGVLRGGGLEKILSTYLD